MVAFDAHRGTVLLRSMENGFAFGEGSNHPSPSGRAQRRSLYHRTEQRGVNLLLKAIPVDQQQSLITDRELTSTALLYRLLVRFQPGGAGARRPSCWPS